jgi:hypothetical protein
MSSLDLLERLVVSALLKDGSGVIVLPHHLQALSCVDFCHGMDDSEYLDGLIYLPGALDALSKNHCAGPEHDRILESVAWFLRCWMDKLRDDGIESPLRQVWIELLHKHDGESPTLAALSATGHIEPSHMNAPIDVDLNALLNPQVEKDNLFFRSVFGTWIGESKSAVHSLSVIDFVVRVRSTMSDWWLYREKSVLDAVFDSGTVFPHWSSCNAECCQRFGEDFCQSPLPDLIGYDGELK